MTRVRRPNRGCLLYAGIALGWVVVTLVLKGWLG